MNTATMIVLVGSKEDNGLFAYEGTSKVGRLCTFYNKQQEAVQFYVNGYGKVGQALTEVEEGYLILINGSFHLKKEEGETYAEFDARTVLNVPADEYFAYISVVGNPGAEPELKTIGELTIANLTIYSRKDADHTDLIRVALYDRNAENIAKFVKKDASDPESKLPQVTVAGRLTFNIDKNGSVWWQVNGDNFELHAAKKSNGGASRKPPTPKVKAVVPTVATEAKDPAMADIPF